MKYFNKNIPIVKPVVLNNNVKHIEDKIDKGIKMLHDQIQEHCKVFKLPRVLEHYQSISATAAKDKLSYSKYLLKLFELEKEGRIISSKEMLLKMAGFPKVKTLDMFDYKSSSVNQVQINEIATLQFIEQTQNILFFGPSGVGKTHLAQSIGYVATQKRIRTKFITMNDLLFQLEAAQSQGKFINYDYIKSHFYKMERDSK